LCAYGITTEGRRELIDFLLVKAEGEDTWYGFLWSLWSRGLRGEFLELMVTDGQPGLIKALGRLWPAVPHQRCWAHKLRNLENKLKASQKACLEEAKLIYQAEHRTEAIRRFRHWKRRWQARAPKAVACLETDLEELLAFFDCPKLHWKRLRTTNVIERLFVEVKRSFASTIVWKETPSKQLRQCSTRSNASFGCNVEPVARRWRQELCVKAGSG